MNSIVGQAIKIHPESPVIDNPVIADIIYSPGDSLYEYEFCT